MIESCVRQLNRIGPFSVAAVVGIAGINTIFLIQAAIATWFPNDPALAVPGGLIRCGDFMGFWAAAKLVAGGEAAAAYEKAGQRKHGGD